MKDERLCEALAALANPLRLALVRKLRTPRPLGDIDLRAADGEDARPLSRQGIKEHLTRLIEPGIVRVVPGGADGRSPVQYVTDHQAIFSLAEETRLLARNRPTVEPDVQTVRVPSDPGASRMPRDCLVLVKGLDEGRVFDLSPQRARSWLVGRRRTAAVCLDFDAQVSSENALIEWDGSHHTLRDLPGSRNGTTLNLAPLPKDAAVRLSHGDLVGAGRTLLLYRR